MLVSVIIPTYNRADKLRRCLNSLVNQTFKDFEVIICDDGSTDDTKLVLGEFDSILKLKYNYNPNFGGPAQPRNNGLKLAEGTFIAFLDSDDWWYDNKLETCLNLFDDCDLIYHKLDRFDKTGKLQAEMKTRAVDPDVFRDLVLNGNQILNSSVIVRKNIVNMAGFVSEDKHLIAAEDYDFWIRISRLTNRFKFIPLNLGAYWIGENISAAEGTIFTENYLLQPYFKYLSKKDELIAKKKLAFRAARTYHNLAMFESARTHYKKSLVILDFGIAFKSVVGLVASILKVKM